MEMGAAAVMANTAIATAGDVPVMAEAFKKAIEAGRSAYLSGLGRSNRKRCQRILSAYGIFRGLILTKIAKIQEGKKDGKSTYQ